MAKADFPPERVAKYRDKVREMFYHAYNGYLEHAYPHDELQPLSCKGVDTWGSFSLTLIDALDTLLIMGNETEFRRAVDLVIANAELDANVNVSVFETNIRVIGGLLSAHLLSGRVSGMQRSDGWPCAGPLLTLAERYAKKLLPAFNTKTGMPYGTVNLRYGVDINETPISCTACVGSLIIEFGTLTKLTGNPIYERVANRALKALWASRSTLGLVGNHIDVQSGLWTATDAGIGAGVDSYFEYLAKGALLFHRPLLMQQFTEYEQAINKHIRKEDWFMWVSMTQGGVTFPIFQSLEAFWPGVLALVGRVDDAARILLTYNQINRQFGVPPEFYNLPTREAMKNRAGYPLRPELIESMMYLHKATDDPHYLHMAASMIEAIEATSRTNCGYATVKDLSTKQQEDRMESFFLSETTKYLYLLFDPTNFIHNDGSSARVITTPSGKCVVHAGGWIFNTEAHPIDPGALYCCSAKRKSDEGLMQKFKEQLDFVSLLDLHDPFLGSHAPLADKALPPESVELDAARKEARAEVTREIERHAAAWNNTSNEARSDDEEPADLLLMTTPAASDASDNAGEAATRSSTPPTVEQVEPTNVKSRPAVPVAPSLWQPSQPLIPTAEAAPAAINAHGAKAQRARKRRKHKTRRGDNQHDNSEPRTEKAAQSDVRKRMKALLADLSKAAGQEGPKVDANKLLQAMSELGSEYSSLLKATERLQRIASTRNQTAYEQIKRQLKQSSVTRNVPISEVLCEDCCVPIDAESQSAGLRAMLNQIYSKHVYAKARLAHTLGPICRHWELPDPRLNYNAEPPGVNASDDVDDEDAMFDAIDGYSFTTFAYRRVAAEHTHWLSSPPQLFETAVQGIGQVLTAPRY